ncbi:NAD(P)/FAD-dependent oxidoreductase [Roseibium sp. SCP14]|uniref:NAD(P)/FAD-dependent oxidoreductase n=1 Tax=Roseibium sp. SCP14 TaxID=3141375 RepID=UPI00333711AA
MNATYDIVVLGAGPAGANAALTAAKAGASVALIDEGTQPGGQVWRPKSAAIVEAPVTPESRSGDALRKSVAGSGVTLMPGARLWQIERPETVWELQVLAGERNVPLRSKALVLATGAREYVQPVPGWTLPGVVGLAGATALFKQELMVSGTNTVVSGTGPLVFYVASEIRRLGGTVAAIVTPNSRRDWLGAFPAMLQRPDLLARGARWITDLMLAGVPVHWRHAVTSVTGSDRVTEVCFRKVGANWSPDGAEQMVKADSLCLGNGLIPAIETAQLAGVPVRHAPELGSWVPETNEDGSTPVPGLFVCGDGAGIRGVAAAEVHGKLTGNAAVSWVAGRNPKPDAKLVDVYRKSARFGLAMTALSIPRSGLQALTTSETVVCRCESLTQKAIRDEIASGAGSTNAVKSGLRCGMGPCGGKYCQTAVARMIAAIDGRADAEISPPTPRPPLRPVPVSALAGDFDYGDLPIPKPAPL